MGDNDLAAKYRQALELAQRVLAELELTAAIYTTSTMPVPLRIDLEEQRKKVGQLEAAWRAAQQQRPAPKPQPAPVQPAAPKPPESEMVLTLAPGVELAFVRVPAGEFLMGSNDSDDEKPPHTVYLDVYWMGKYPVTVAQYWAFCKATGGSALPIDVMKLAQHPMVNVSWDDAVAFCQWASQVTGQAIRLPTEAQWEKAARGPLTSSGCGRIYPWGDTFDAAKCNCSESKIGTTTPVGKYSPGLHPELVEGGDSPYGCADMAGNVWEWCADWYAADYYARSPAWNPMGPSSGQGRVLRGGGWSHNPVDARTANRTYGDPFFRRDFIGLRCLVISPGQ